MAKIVTKTELCDPPNAKELPKKFTPVRGAFYWYQYPGDSYPRKLRLCVQSAQHSSDDILMMIDPVDGRIAGTVDFLKSDLASLRYTLADNVVITVTNK